MHLSDRRKSEKRNTIDTTNFNVLFCSSMRKCVSFVFLLLQTKSKAEPVARRRCRLQWSWHVSLGNTKMFVKTTFLLWFFFFGENMLWKQEFVSLEQEIVRFCFFSSFARLTISEIIKLLLFYCHDQLGPAFEISGQGNNHSILSVLVSGHKIAITIFIFVLFI